MNNEQPSEPYNAHGAYGTPAHASPEGIVSGSLHEGWEAFKRDPVLLVGFFLLKVAFVVLASWLLKGGILGDIVYHDESGSLYEFRELIVTALIALLDGVLTAGVLFAALHIVRRETAPFMMLFAGFRRFVPLVVVQVITHTLIGFGIVFFVLPGIFIALALAQWPFLIMDRRTDILDTIEASWKMMRGFKTELLLLWLVLIGINLVGLIPLGLGLIVTVPFTYAVQAAFYERVLAAQAQATIPLA